MLAVPVLWIEHALLLAALTLLPHQTHLVRSRCRHTLMSIHVKAGTRGGWQVLCSIVACFSPLETESLTQPGAFQYSARPVDLQAWMILHPQCWDYKYAWSHMAFFFFNMGALDSNSSHHTRIASAIKISLAISGFQPVGQSWPLWGSNDLFTGSHIRHPRTQWGPCTTPFWKDSSKGALLCSCRIHVGVS